MNLGYYSRMYNNPKYNNKLYEYVSYMYRGTYGNKSLSQSKEAIKCFCFNIVKIIYYGLDGAYISFDKTKYSEIIVNGKSVKASVGYKATTNIIRLLETTDFLNTHKGYRYEDGGDVFSESGYFILKDGLKQKVLELVDFTKIRFPILKNVIILKDCAGNLLEFPQTKEIKSMIGVVNGYNRMMQKHLVTRVDEATGEILKYPVQARRIFSRGDFKYHGRFYLDGGSVQSLESILRKDLLIDYEATVEVDLKGLHLALIHEIEGSYWLDGYDPYNVLTDSICVDGYMFGKYVEEHNKKYNPTRNVIKLALLVIINSKSIREAKYALIEKIEEDKKKAINEQKFYAIEYIEYEQLFTDIMDHHSEVSSWFFSDKGVELMNLDSKMVGYVIEKATEKDVPVIGIHDSFVCKKEDVVNVMSWMRKGYENVVGSSNNCIIEIK